MASFEEGTILDQHKKYNLCMCTINYFVTHVPKYLPLCNDDELINKCRNCTTPFENTKRWLGKIHTFK